ncbi:MAG: hypothetical protein U0V03_00810 [Bacteroidia bacterium]
MNKHVVINILTRLSIAVFNFATIILLSQLKGAEFKGVCTKIIAIASIAQIASEIGGGAVIVKMAQKKRILQLFSFNLVIMCIISIFTTGYAITIFDNLFLLLMLFFICVFASLSSFIGYYCLSKQAIGMYNLINFIQPFLMFIILYFAKDTLAISTFIIAFTISYCIALFIGLIYLFVQLKKDKDLEELSYKEISHNSLIAIVSHISGFLTQRIFYFILPYFILGVYSNALSVAESALIIANSLSTYLYSKLSSVDNLNEQLKLTKQYIKINSLIMVFGYLLVLFIPSDFYVYFFGNDFSQVNVILKYAFPGVIFNSIHLIVGHYFSSRANFKINLYLTISGFISTLLFALVLVNKKEYISVNTAAIMYSVSYFVVFFMAIYFFYNQIKINNEQITKAT